MELLNVKGSNDFLPEEQIIRNEITDKLKTVFESYGYMPIETTTICYYDLLASKYAGGAEILKEVYKLTDQGKRDLALRYDLTVPFAKVISMNKNLKLPFRRYEIGKVYRDGPVKLGRDREFYQCDVDVCGIKSQMVEAEFFDMTKNCFDKLGINVYIEWNNRKLLSGLVEVSGISSDLISRVILSVDKLAKIGAEGVIKELEEYNIDKNKLGALFELFKLDINELKNKFMNTNNEMLKQGLEEVLELQNYIDNLGLNICKFTPYLARGLEIYTGTIWEVFDEDKRITSSLGGGGRYDKIITNFINDGNLYPAVGMTFGLVPIYEIVKMNGKDCNNTLYDLYLIPMDTNIETLNIASKLRDKKIKVIIEMNNKKIKKCFEWANKCNIPYVSVIGENELNDNKISIKNMYTGESVEFNIDDIDSIINFIRK